ncbi:TPA: hypothetical protein L3916_004323 [Pseudomonas aeruginosa]|uniref:hypothetical protein n=1 Tax=Pseudomonas aeruginosa TaxID=287 RepID=UPI0024991434|nr:hypothetical protein [Pseudomonas aeruginosa]MDI2247775.1 hypothetical protein [Pseudomonas aeruginosa]MDP5901174.1 hypothetical protein [Pseudomonas aeruginosa]HBN9691739.1 hypothetical protein [Pseudomonas aeruginosa]
MTKLIVDRPRSPFLTIDTGKGKGKRVLASYSWGDPGNKLPVKVRVFVEVNGTDFFIEEISGPFNSLEDAAEKALASGTSWYDRDND